MSFKFNAATITARPLSIGDEEDTYAVLEFFPEGKRTVRVLNYIQFVFAADIEGDFPVPVLPADAEPQAWLDGYALWRKLPRSFPEQWEKELAFAEGSPKE